MIKVIAIGDIHGMWAEAWRALKLAQCGYPFRCTHRTCLRWALSDRFYGRSVHYKDYSSYDAVVDEDFDPYNPKHLKSCQGTNPRTLSL
ncbi:MAG: hypothetical protein R2865_02620 [Deinococcales bacterium]